MTRTEQFGRWLVPVTGLTLMLFPAAVIGYRLDMWEFKVSFMLLQLQALCALLVLLLGGGLIIAARRQRDSAMATTGYWIVLFCLVVIALLSYQVYKAKTLPFIHDVTTDTRFPPEFEVIARLRGEGDHPVTYEGESVASLQREKYADLVPLVTPVDPEQAYIRLKAIIHANGWELVADEPERGHLEAVIHSVFFDFKDDLVIRIQRFGDETRIDFRSASRIGRSDLGANADRIRRIRENFGQ